MVKIGKMVKMKKTYKKRRGGKLPRPNEEEITQTIDSQVEENNNDDNVPRMRELMNRYNRLIEPIRRNDALIYPESPPTTPPRSRTPTDTPPRRNQMPDYDSDEEFERPVPGAPRRPRLTRENALNARELELAFPPMYDSDSDEEIMVDENFNNGNNIPRQGGRKRKTTKKRKIVKIYRN